MLEKSRRNVWNSRKITTFAVHLLRGIVLNWVILNRLWKLKVFFKVIEQCYNQRKLNSAVNRKAA